MQYVLPQVLRPNVLAIRVSPPVIRTNVTTSATVLSCGLYYGNNPPPLFFLPNMAKQSGFSSAHNQLSTYWQIKIKSPRKLRDTLWKNRDFLRKPLLVPNVSVGFPAKASRSTG
jgi:hypothetical protein